MRRLRLTALVIVVVVALVLFGGWRGLLWASERTAAFSGPLQPVCGSPAGGQRFGRAAQRAGRHVQAMLAERQIPGLAVAVTAGGELVWSQGFGYADRERRLPACPWTRFRIGSVSKLLTVAALARLHQQGRLALDAPIQRYVPEFPDKGAAITPRQLASHRSGIRHYRDDAETLTTRHCDRVGDGLEAFAGDPLLFTPDTGFAYSSYGYVLLSTAIERAAGQPFLSYLAPFSPDGSVRQAPAIDLSCRLAAGGLLSTAEDLARFGAAHLRPQAGFLRRDTLDLLFRPRTRQLGVFAHGLGWSSAYDLHLRRVHFQFGAVSGGTAVLAVWPRQRVSVAILANLGHARFPAGRLFGIVNPFLDDPARPVTVAFLAGAATLGTLLVVRLRRRRRLAA
jgi:serine beta-lactamase-like protein LACTB, mitochondrial